MRAVGHRDLQSVERIARPADHQLAAAGSDRGASDRDAATDVIFGLPPDPAGSAPPIEGISTQSTIPWLSQTLPFASNS